MPENNSPPPTIRTEEEPEAAPLRASRERLSYLAEISAEENIKNLQYGRRIALTACRVALAILLALYITVAFCIGGKCPFPSTGGSAPLAVFISGSFLSFIAVFAAAIHGMLSKTKEKESEFSEKLMEFVQKMPGGKK